MATQSLYRRYRPRRFSELRGQDHVVRALRDAVRTGREGQAYLFSGPRGTGKTTSARILAKVLNCEAPVDGEPCCACPSCLAVEQGTSYDVHELDAASNNGVADIRDLIEKASLGTPGRHRVYILDEVHMLSKAAEAALLKTLEEPPAHVVFVLATTDPQKVSDTIRSRTQHLQFHLLPADTLADHIRWVADDAGIQLGDDVLEAAVRRGGGSARDTLSALELLVATGGDPNDLVDLDDVVRALIDHDAGLALAAVGRAVSLGHDPRTLTEAIVRHLRDGFLALMAPELVQLPADRVDALAASAHEIGAPALVRAIERLGSALVDMRHAPDPRILLDVALAQLTRPALSNDPASLLDRIERLERTIAEGGGAPAPSAAPAPATTTAPAPVDPGTGRAVLGGRARRSATTSTSTPATDPTQGHGTEQESATDTGDDASPATSGAEPASTEAADAAPAATATSAPADTQPAPAATSPAATSPAATTPAEATAIWEQQVRPSLKPLVRAIYSAGHVTRHDGPRWHFAVPNQVHGDKCAAHRGEVEAALTAALGSPVELVIEVGAGRAGDQAGTTDSPPDRRADRPAARGADRPDARSAGPSTSPGAERASDTPPRHDDGDDGEATDDGDPRAGHPAPTPSIDPIDDEADIDLDELTDAPPETARTPLDRLAEAFPGAELVDGD